MEKIKDIESIDQLMDGEVINEFRDSFGEEIFRLCNSIYMYIKVNLEESIDDYIKVITVTTNTGKIRVKSKGNIIEVDNYSFIIIDGKALDIYGGNNVVPIEDFIKTLNNLNRNGLIKVTEKSMINCPNIL